MSRVKRRDFLQTALGAAGLAGWGGAAPSSLWAQAQTRPAREKLPVAAVVTLYKNNSHADVLIGKILEGFRQDGGKGPDLRLASLYTDQVPKSDLSRDLAKKHGFKIAGSIEEAITLGTGKVAVAGVISVGEHGDYPFTPDTHQHMYPRRRFFDEIVAALRKGGKVVPIFNDKHLGYAWKDASHMARVAKKMHMPLMAGSSIPVAWRVPPLSLPLGCELTSALGLGYGGLESYGFHALEGLQCMVERRKGGETGVAAVQAVSGEQVEAARKQGRWSAELLKSIAAVTPAAGKNRPRELGSKAVLYLIEYRDGLQAAVAMQTGVANQFAFAGRLGGEDRPRATWFQLEEDKPFGHFAYLLKAIEHMVHSGKPAYPFERTLLTTGMLDALLHSHADGGKRIETPHLAIRYQAVDWPFAPGTPATPKKAS